MTLSHPPTHPLPCFNHPNGRKPPKNSTALPIFQPVTSVYHWPHFTFSWHWLLNSMPLPNLSPYQWQSVLSWSLVPHSKDKVENSWFKMEERYKDFPLVKREKQSLLKAKYYLGPWMKTVKRAGPHLNYGLPIQLTPASYHFPSSTHGFNWLASNSKWQTR